MIDLHTRLVAALQSRLEVARAARGDQPWTYAAASYGPEVRVGPDETDLWSRECNAQGLAMRRRAGRLSGASTRLGGAEGRYIAANDPTAEIARCEALLRVVERHAPQQVIGTPPEWEDVFSPLRCLSCERQPLWPCSDIRDLAAGEGIEVDDDE